MVSAILKATSEPPLPGPPLLISGSAIRRELVIDRAFPLLGPRDSTNIPYVGMTWVLCHRIITDIIISRPNRKICSKLDREKLWPICYISFSPHLSQDIL